LMNSSLLPHWSLVPQSAVYSQLHCVLDPTRKPVADFLTV
jgi:hypothetical protein